MPCATRLLLKAPPFLSSSQPFFLLTFARTTYDDHARRHLSHATDGDASREEPPLPLLPSCSTEPLRPPGVRRFDAPTMLSSRYATTIEGLCHARKTNAAIKVLEKMMKTRVADRRISTSCCDAILGTLTMEEERLNEALGFVERYPLYGISPDVCTYNILVKGFCKRRDVDGANKVLKLMTRRGLTPTSATYNHFLRMFSKTRDVGAGMNLYEKLLKSGFTPDLLTYRIMIDMLCRSMELGMAVKVIRDMKRSGFELDLKESSMLVQMLCDSCRWDEACVEFEVMIEEGKVPRYGLYKRLLRGVKRLGMEETAGRISRLMHKVLRSGKLLPENYWEREGERSCEVKRAIFEKAKVISEALKVSRRERKRADKSTARRRFFSGRHR